MKHIGTTFPILLAAGVLAVGERAIAQPTEVPPPIVQPAGEEAYQALLQFLNYDRGQPLDARIVAREEIEEYEREKVVFNGIRGARVPGYLAFPKDHARPCPVVLELHGMTGNKNAWWQDQEGYRGGLVTRGLLASGIAVLALDGPSHGERISTNDYESPWNPQEVEYRDHTLRGVVEYRIAMDYLATRAEVDTSRLGVIGYSMGGVQTFMLTAADARVRTAVACVPPPTGYKMARRYAPNLTVAQYLADAALTPPRVELANPQQWARGIGSRPFLMLVGRTDEWYTPDEAQQLFDLVPSPTKELVFYDSGHALPPEYATKTVQWLVAHLK